MWSRDRASLKSSTGTCARVPLPSAELGRLGASFANLGLVWPNDTVASSSKLYCASFKTTGYKAAIVFLVAGALGFVKAGGIRSCTFFILNPFGSSFLIIDFYYLTCTAY